MGRSFWGLWRRKTSPSSAKSARSWGSRKHLRCGCGSAAAQRIARWWQSPWRPSRQCPSPWGAPRWLGRRGVNKSSCCRGGDGCCVWVSVGLSSCSFLLFWSISLRHWLLYTLWGFWIAQCLLPIWILYWFYFIHSIMGHRACSVFATPGV